MALPRKYWVFNLYSAVPVPTQSSAVLVEVVELESTTYCLQGSRSVQLELYPHVVIPPGLEPGFTA